MEPIYRVEGATADTSAFAGGPWDPKLQHGAAPSSLICWAVERLPAPAPMRVARLTVDLMRPVPVAPLTIETELLREGRKIQLVSVRLLAPEPKWCAPPCCACGAWSRCCRSRRRGRRSTSRVPRTATIRRRTGCRSTPFLSGLEMRVAKGSFRTPGPAAVWYRATRPIVDGAPLSPLMRAAIAADFCNGTSAVLDFTKWTFINGDLTLSLAREPVGDWVLLDAETWAGPNSIGIAAARLADRDGYFGRAVQSVLFEKR